VVRKVSKKFLVFLKLGLEGIIFQLNDPWFPYPKNRWRKYGIYPAIEAVKEFHNNPKLAHFVAPLYDQGENGTRAKPSTWDKAQKIGDTEMMDRTIGLANRPQDDMDIHPLTWFLGPFLSETMRLLLKPQLFNSQTDHVEFLDVFVKFSSQLITIWDPIKGKGIWSRLKKEFCNCITNEEEWLGAGGHGDSTEEELNEDPVSKLMAESDAAQRVIDSAYQFQQLVISRGGLQVNPNLVPEYTRRQNNAREAEKQLITLVKDSHKEIPGVLFHHPPLLKASMQAYSQQNPEPRAEDVQRMGSVKSEVYKKGLDSALAGKPWDYALVPFIHVRDRSFDLKINDKVFTAIATRVIPPGMRVMLQDWEDLYVKISAKISKVCGDAYIGSFKRLF
jgi:hypothetical protein